MDYYDIGDGFRVYWPYENDCVKSYAVYVELEHHSRMRRFLQKARNVDEFWPAVQACWLWRDKLASRPVSQ